MNTTNFFRLLILCLKLLFARSTYARGFGSRLKTAIHSIPALWPFNLKPYANIKKTKERKRKSDIW